MTKIDIGNFHKEKQVGTIDDGGNLETESGAFEEVARPLIEEGVASVFPFAAEGEDGEEEIAYREFVIEPGTEGFLREFVDALPSPYDCDLERLDELPTFDPDEYMSKVGKEWVEDPTEEAPDRWVNTTTGEYRYQETKPEPGDGGGDELPEDWESVGDNEEFDFSTLEEGQEVAVINPDGEEEFGRVKSTLEDMSATVVTESRPGGFDVPNPFGHPSEIISVNSDEPEETPALHVDEDEREEPEQQLEEAETSFGQVTYSNEATEGNIREKSVERFKEEYGDEVWESIERTHNYWEGYDPEQGALRGDWGPESSEAIPIWQVGYQMTGNNNHPKHEVSGEPPDSLEKHAEHTQEVLREVFGDEVTVKRGLHGEIAEKMIEAKENDETVEWEHKTVESWTTEEEIAETFAFEMESDVGVIVEQEIPVENVVSSGHTGATEGVESEFVVAHDETSELSPENIVRVEE